MKKAIIITLTVLIGVSGVLALYVPEDDADDDIY